MISSASRNGGYRGLVFVSGWLHEEQVLAFRHWGGVGVDLLKFETEYFSVSEHLALGPGLGLHLLLASCCARHYWECSKQLRLTPSLLSSPWLWHGCFHRFQEEQETVSHPVPAASARVASTSPCGECELDQTHTLTRLVAMTSGCCWGGGYS